MNDEWDQESWLSEYREFTEIKLTNAEVPEPLSKAISARLFPNPFAVFAKITLIHIFVGFLSLGVCHQFGLNPFSTHTSLADWFMKVGGHNFCMLACGAIFMMSTYLLANLFLNFEELEAILRYKWLKMSTLSLISLASFYFFGAQLVFLFAILWITGALIGAWLSLEVSYVVRRHINHQ